MTSKTRRDIISAALEAIREAAGEYAVSDDNPCGLQAYHDDGEALPWRIADDYASESYATAEEARQAAAEWAAAMGN